MAEWPEGLTTLAFVASGHPHRRASNFLQNVEVHDLRILHAVTLLTPDGAYGGPVRVALNQAAALRSRGHAVTLAAAERGIRVSTFSGGNAARARARRQIVPRSGFAGLSAPGLVRWLLRAHREFDVAHIHLARYLVLVPLTMLMVRSEFLSCFSLTA